jgi:hypothetical protein
MDFHNVVLEKIELVERDHKKLPSHQKHEFARALIKQSVEAQWGKEIWNKYSPVIDGLIHFIIALSKNKKLLSNINRRCCGGGWCGWCIG